MGGDPVDPGLGGHGVEGLVDLAGVGLRGLGPGAVTPGGPGGVALIAPGADLGGDPSMSPTRRPSAPRVTVELPPP